LSYYSHAIGTDEEDISSIVVEDEVDFMSLILYLRKENVQALEGVHRRIAITICLEAFLFIGGSENRRLAMLQNVVEGIRSDQLL